MAEFTHQKLALRLVLPEAADLKQRDVDKFMAAFSAQKQGNSPREDNGKTLRAALKAGWVKDSEPALKAEQVDDLSPAVVRWFAERIDRLYVEASTVPPE